MIRILLALMALVLLFGFGECKERETVVVPPAVAQPTPVQTQTTELDSQLHAASEQAAAAAKAGDKIKELEAKREVAELSAKKYWLMYEQSQQEAKALDQQIKDEKARQLIFWLYATAGLFILAGGICLALGLYLKMRTLIEIALACGGAAALCFVAGVLVPYLLWIALGAVAAIVLWTVYTMRRYHMTLGQVVGAVEAAKDGQAMKLDDYKAHFRQYIDTASDALINTVRKQG